MESDKETKRGWKIKSALKEQKIGRKVGKEIKTQKYRKR